MKFDLIKKYFNFIEKHIQSNGYFLNINRFEKTSVGYPIYFHEYPYSNRWKKYCHKLVLNKKIIYSFYVNMDLKNKTIFQ